MSDQERLVFEGEAIYGSKLTVRGDVAMGEVSALKRHQRFAVVARGEVDKVGFEDVKDVPTRVHAASLVRSVIVDDELADDVFDEAHERLTGQLRLLSADGEHRRAARAILAERRRQVALGHDAEQDDGHESGAHFARRVLDNQFRRLLDLSVEDGEDLAAWLEANERELVQAAAVCMAGVEWCRRRMAEHLDHVVEEATRAARAEGRTVIDVNGTVATPDEAAALRGVPALTAGSTNGEAS